MVDFTDRPQGLVMPFCVAKKIWEAQVDFGLP